MYLQHIPRCKILSQNIRNKHYNDDEQENIFIIKGIIANIHIYFYKTQIYTITHHSQKYNETKTAVFQKICDRTRFSLPRAVIKYTNKNYYFHIHNQEKLFYPQQI